MDEIEYKKETDGIMISAKTGENIELLRDEIIKKLITDNGYEVV